MAGIYIHIPFCKSKCIYCDFYSLPNTSMIDNFIDIVCIEIISKKNYLLNIKIDTIYIGGGTPTILSIYQINKIINTLYDNFNIDENPEITIEANPDDLTNNYIKELINTKINRLSIGIQNLNDNILRFMKRRHNAKDAIKTVINAHDAGIVNISVDLIYGINGLSDKDWQNQLTTILNLPITHLSAYHLTIAKNTNLYYKIKHKQYVEIDENNSYDHYKILIETTNKMNMPQYEISNFSKIDYRSKHNCSYWERKEYLGFGPSAHSFINNKRFYNVNDIDRYISAEADMAKCSKIECLSKHDAMNEVIMLELRTVKGIDIQKFIDEFGKENYMILYEKWKTIQKKYIKNTQGYLSLSNSGLFISNTIITKLFDM